MLFKSRPNVYAGIVIIAVAGLVFGRTTPSSAQILNGSFENTVGNDGFTPTSWTVTGGAAVLTSQFGVTPTDGTNQAFITNDATGTPYVYGSEYNIAPSDTPGEIASALGTSTTAINSLYQNTTAVDGSSISQVISGTAGQTLTFDWDYLTAEDPQAGTYGAAYNDDYAFVSVNGTDYALDDSYSFQSEQYNTPLPGPSTVSPSNTDYLYQSGYQTYSLTLPTTGSYVLGFAVVDGDTSSNPDGNDVASSLLVDNVSLSNGNIAPAPESGTAIQWLILLSIGGCFSIVRFCKNKRKRA